MFSFILVLISYVLQVQCIQIIWDNDAVLDGNNIEEQTRSGQVRMPNWFFIFPGTKWCGAGSIADNDDDLGQFADTDMCCRSHDKCDDSIEGYQTKYNLTNPSFYTRLSCACDDEFHKCLKDVNTHVSTQVGYIYFNAISTKCFKKDYPIVECKKFVYVPTKKCMEYEYDHGKEKQYQWFDVPAY